LHNLGHTRSANPRRDHLLHTPDAFVRSPLPGLARGMVIVHVSAAAGAAFTQYTAEIEPGGTLEPATRSASSTSSPVRSTSPPSSPSARLRPRATHTFPPVQPSSSPRAPPARIVVIEKALPAGYVDH